MTREKAEQRALELYPLYNGGQKELRKAYLKCWEDMQEEVKDESEDWKIVMDCAQAIVNVVKDR